MTAILIDLHKLNVLKITPTIKQAEAWARILLNAEQDFVIVGEEKRDFAMFSDLELRMMHANVAKRELMAKDYAQALHETHDRVMMLQHDETSLEDLQKRLKGRPTIAEHDGASTAFRPDPPVPGTGSAPATKSEAKPVSRPAGGTTAKVWEIADATQAANPGKDLKALRILIIAACTAAGINEATAATQYSKWKKAP